ncbi:MAG: hypothetical protein RML95_05310 [Anaerolineae bacterium]|nr:hypothetical protein [Anaerolineae bacterium]MDW8298736.1 hypothetical protein [Anaerolineae bacterium]
MRSCLAFFVFLFVFLPLAFCGLLFGAVSTWLFDRNFYTDLFSAEGIYSALLSADLDLETSLQINNVQLDPETSRAFALALRDAFTPSYVRDEVVRNINAVFDYLEDFSRGLTLTWDLRPFKRGLTNDQIAIFADTLVRTLPRCAPNAPPVDSLLPTCIPPNVSTDQMVAQARERLPRFIESLPDIQVLGDPIPPNTQSGALLGSTLQSAIGGGALSILIVAFFVWLFVGILAARSTKGLWRVLGITLLVPAVPVLLIGIAILSGAADTTLASGIDSTLAQAGVQSTETLRASTLRAVQGAVSRIGNGFLTYGGGATAVAVVLLLLGALMPKPRKRKDIGIASSDVITPLR